MRKEHAVKLADEVIWGAEAIGTYCRGDIEPLAARKWVYNSRERHGLPAFKVGKKVCAKKSALDRWIAEKAGELDG